MFKKPFRIKTNTVMKGSDRKKLRADVGRSFPALAAEVLTEIIPAKEEMTTTKIYSHAGDNIFIYSVGKIPLLFELDRVLYPTVYLLWRYPDLLSVFTTWPPVFTKLAEGADLMLPGVVLRQELSPTTFTHLHKNDLCSVVLLGNRAPVAVGVTLMSGSDMFDSGMKGKGIHIVHILGDELWSFGDKSQPPNLGDDPLPAEVVDGEMPPDKVSEETVIASLKELDFMTDSDTQSEVKHCGPVQNDTSEPGTTVNSDVVTGTCGDTSDAVARPGKCKVVEDTDKLPTELMDDLLYTCFLCALKTSVKKTDLPLLTSAFFRSHMIPYCPGDKSLDVKKSSHKKLSKFLQVMENQGFLKVKELSKGVDSITEVDKSHSELRGFVIPEGYGSEDCSTEAGATAAPQVTEMFAVTAPVLTLFKPAGYSKGSALTSLDIRTVVTMYVRNNSLQNESQVTLDPLLAEIVLEKGENNIMSLAWDDLFARIKKKLQPIHQVVLQPGQAPVTRKGNVQSIKIDVVQRASNKKATLVENLEGFGIDPQEFAHVIQIKVACSSSVNQLPQKNKGLQVMVQGNQTAAVVDLLTDKYKIAKRHIQAIEKAPKSKKR